MTDAQVRTNGSSWLDTYAKGGLMFVAAGLTTLCGLAFLLQLWSPFVEFVGNGDKIQGPKRESVVLFMAIGLVAMVLGSLWIRKGIEGRGDLRKFLWPVVWAAATTALMTALLTLVPRVSIGLHPAAVFLAVFIVFGGSLGIVLGPRFHTHFQAIVAAGIVGLAIPFLLLEVTGAYYLAIGTTTFSVNAGDTD